jgi:hypothetical protein
MVPWLSGQLGHCYQPAAHGLASDWALDLVVVEFAKPGVRALLLPQPQHHANDWLLGLS